MTRARNCFAPVALALFLAAPLASFAQSDANGGPPPGGAPHGPPPEAIAACNGKAIGTVVLP